MLIPVDLIIVPPDRLRQDPHEDINSLAQSIAELGVMRRANGFYRGGKTEGLLQPIIVQRCEMPFGSITKTCYKVVDGVRRFLACTEILKWEWVECTQADDMGDQMTYLRAQYDANEQRAGFTRYEKLLAAAQMLDAERERAAARRTSGKPAPSGEKGKATERVGAAVGMSHATVEHGLAVIASEHEDLRLAIHNGQSIDSAWHELRLRELDQSAPLPEYHPPAVPAVVALIDKLDGVSTSIRRWLMTRLQSDTMQALHDSAPGYVEQLTINGKDYIVSVWVRQKESLHHEQG